MTQIITALIVSFITYYAFAGFGLWLSVRTERRTSRLSAIHRDLWGSEP